MKKSLKRAGVAAVGLTTVTSLSLLAGSAWAADGAGALDTTFGAGTKDGTPAGVVSTSLGKGDDVANDLAVGADGSVLVVGNLRWSPFSGQICGVATLAC